ncbi:MAG: hypothetical protein ACYDHQ_04655 [Coriobacteriia bacterium]
MAQHYSFIDDAVMCFGEAFKTYEAEAAKTEDKRTLPPLAACCRLLYVALEKGFKHSLANIDPHLLLAKPDRQLLLELRRDLIDRPVPTIFCSRQSFDTVGLTHAWDALRSLAPEALDEQAASDFDRALRRLVQVRHRAQHGEWFEEPEEVLAVVRQVFARFQSVMSSVAPEFLSHLIADNGQLQSRLHAIEADVDVSWQVLTDYLRERSVIRMVIDLFAVLPEEGENLSVLFGRNGVPNAMFGSGDVPLSMADGFFVATLTKAQAFDRYSERKRRLAEADPAVLRALPEGVEGIVPLETGHLSVPSTSAWLSLRLAPLVPPQLHASAMMTRFSIAFEDPDSVRGAVHGVLECAVRKPGTHTEAICVNGDAFVDLESYHEPDEESAGEYRRLLQLALTLSLESPSTGAGQQTLRADAAS